MTSGFFSAGRNEQKNTHTPPAHTRKFMRRMYYMCIVAIVDIDPTIGVSTHNYNNLKYYIFFYTRI